MNQFNKIYFLTKKMIIHGVWHVIRCAGTNSITYIAHTKRQTMMAKLAVNLTRCAMTLVM